MNSSVTARKEKRVNTVKGREAKRRHALGRKAWGNSAEVTDKQ